jgi:hypothetical protein
MGATMKDRIYVDPKACELLENPDTLSVHDVTVWRNGGRVYAANGEVRDAACYVSGEAIKRVLAEFHAPLELVTAIRSIL